MFKKVIQGIVVWLISPVYFTGRFIKYFGWDVKESVKDNLIEEYVVGYKELFKKTKKIYKGEVDWMGNKLIEDDFGNPYKE